MSLLNNLFGNTPSKFEVMKKGMEGCNYYKAKDFKNAIKSFELYFEMKGNGKFPEIDNDDPGMLLNLGNAKYFSLDIEGASQVYEAISKIRPTWDIPYFMNSYCQNTLGNKSKSKVQWELARKFGNERAQNPFEQNFENL